MRQQRRTHITVHEFSAVRSHDDWDHVIVSAEPRIIKVAQIEDVRPVKPDDRPGAYTMSSPTLQAHPLPDQFKSYIYLGASSYRFAVTETVEQIQALIDGKEIEDAA